MTKELDLTFTKVMTDWYAENKRDLPWRIDKNPYHVWVSEIMLQQTRVEAVRDYYIRFMKELPAVKDLAQADEQTLLKLWQGLGYYNRIRNMHKAATVIEQDFGGIFPKTYEDIKALPGIGDYTAGAIASICFDRKVAAVDGNVLRVMSRLCEDYEDIKNAAMKKRMAAYLQALYPKENCGDFTQGLIELGALICVPNGQPKCHACPVSGYCKARANGTISQLPVKSSKKERKKIKKTVFILQCGDKIAVRKRGKKGLLAGLYEFPNVDQELTAEQAVKQVEDWGCRPRDLQRKAEYKHIFTHVEWEMTGYYFSCDSENEDFQWANQKEMAEEIPLPSAFGYFI
ncbi:A/G-specific adenine glycosylase [Emergencia timonensis]|uniref:A/G-specific adenine glycosylase n=1 Tax=Emergencia timonensis TaxID=1776384 RepID=UPI003991239C